MTFVGNKLTENDVKSGHELNSISPQISYRQDLKRLKLYAVKATFLSSDYKFFRLFFYFMTWRIFAVKSVFVSAFLQIRAKIARFPAYTRPPTNVLRMDKTVQHQQIK